MVVLLIELLPTFTFLLTLIRAFFRNLKRLAFVCRVIFPFFLCQAFQELQIKVQDSSHRVRLAEIQMDQLKRAIAHASLTDRELAALPTGTKTYQSVGRM